MELKFLDFLFQFLFDLHKFQRLLVILILHFTDQLVFILHFLPCKQRLRLHLPLLLLNLSTLIGQSECKYLQSLDSSDIRPLYFLQRLVELNLLGRVLLERLELFCQ